MGIKRYQFCVIVTLLSFILFSSKGLSSTSAPSENKSKGLLEISFDFKRQGTIASNQFAVWIEDEKGKLVKTLYVSRFTAKGGYLFRKDCLPIWVEKAKPSSLPPEAIDAITGATPSTGPRKYTWDGKDENGNYVPSGKYRFCIEATLYWTNRVLYSGVFLYGGESQENIPISVKYFDGESNKDMIQNVKAKYIASK
ncbi:MAG: DUF2271 domain-containing protein [bacterium]|nr:DUF2271 domain-containing protein [bacterium]